jgi:hypothetical protein
MLSAGVSLHGTCGLIYCDPEKLEDVCWLRPLISLATSAERQGSIVVAYDLRDSCKRAVLHADGVHTGL